MILHQSQPSHTFLDIGGRANTKPNIYSLWQYKWKFENIIITRNEHQNEAKQIIYKPILLTDLSLVKVKYNLYLSNQMVQTTTPLIILTTIASFKRIQKSKVHKSCSWAPWKIKLLYLTTHCQMKLMKGHVIKRWYKDCPLEQKKKTSR
jgi:hypothetical protein